MVALSALSIFVLSFFMFEKYVNIASAKIASQQEKLESVKDKYYLAMSEQSVDIIDNSDFIVEEYTTTTYKIKLVSNNILPDLFVIRQK